MAVLFAMVGWLTWQFRNAIIDDGYIYLRVAENIVNGHGWVFNLGERVNPCTSSPFTILLVVIRFFCSSPVVTLLTAYSSGLIAIFTIQYLALRGESRALAFAIAAASVLEPLLFRSVGMETTLFLTCILGAAWAYQKNAMVLCGTLSALAAMNRPEGLALIVLISGIHAFRKRESTKKAQLAFLAILLPWLIFSHLYFGALVSNSISAKAAQASLGVLNFHMSWGQMLLHRMWYPPVTILPAILGACLAVLNIRKGNCYAAIVILFGFIQIAAYTILRAPFNYRWYFAPANLAINMAVLIAFFRMLGGLRVWVRRNRSLPDADSGRIWTTASVVAGLLLVSRLGAVPFEVPEPYDSDAEYITAGRWIRNHSSEKDRVACVEIGYLGYVTQRPIIDVYGLIHPEALPAIQNLDLTWWFNPANPPEFIVRHRSPWPGEPGPNWGPLWSTFLQQYRPVIRIGRLLVFRKVKA